MEATKRKRKAPFRKLPVCKVDKELLRLISFFFANFSAQRKRHPAVTGNSFV